MVGQPASELAPDTDFLRHSGGQALCQLLEDAGHQAFYVGGCVRNALMGVAATDIDLCTDARPDQVMSLAGAAGYKALPTGIDHGTVTVVIDGDPLEVTTFRKDVETDGRRAVVAFADSMEADARRRDFTMNALYCDRHGRVWDPVGGLRDVMERRVRFIDNPSDRIGEDHLRTLRFFRFSAWYGDLTVGWDPNTLSAIAETLNGLERLSAERIGTEMLKLLAAPDPVSAISVMHQVGVLGRILPGADPQFLAPFVHLETEAGLQPHPVGRLAALGGEDVAGRLRLSRKQHKAWQDVRMMSASPLGPKALGHEVGQTVGQSALMLRAAIAQTPLAHGWPQDVEVGADTNFPVAASDLPHLSGAELGAALKAMKHRWLASDLSLPKAELLGQ